MIKLIIFTKFYFNQIVRKEEINIEDIYLPIYNLAIILIHCMCICVLRIIFIFLSYFTSSCPIRRSGCSLPGPS